MKKKLIIDILMLVLMILEFSRMYMPTILHEIIGIMLFILVILHLYFNKIYLKNISNGKYTLQRSIMLVVNIIFLLSFILSILFGVLSSQDLLKFMNIGNMQVIKLHKMLSYVCLICTGFHLGMNFDIMVRKINKLINNKYVVSIVSFLIIIFGIYSFYHLDIFNHLTGKYTFSLVTENIVINFLEYLSIVLMVAVIVHLIFKVGKRK